MNGASTANTIRVSDLWEAAFLVCLGHQADMEINDDDLVDFCFQATSSVRKDLVHYQHGGEIRAKLFRATVRRGRGLIRLVRRGRRPIVFRLGEDVKPGMMAVEE